MDYYYLNEVPIFTYVMVGITTMVLAVASMQDYDSNNEAEVKQEPTVLSSLTNPTSSTATPTQGGKKTRKNKSRK
jgi:hypothetical protein